ncbi:unnamed protein product [Blepharisma stoltei]|uniref:Uncharacterized protein n=1 Tax=Blepharisma stoltei TaxID=1481888 RepID=A0AAU9J5W6_9CILI|nr:unnamed protein product [Blepharisma stoltei]
MPGDIIKQAKPLLTKVSIKYEKLLKIVQDCKDSLFLIPWEVGLDLDLGLYCLKSFHPNIRKKLNLALQFILLQRFQLL